MARELSRCREILIDTYRDVTKLQDVICFRMPFDNGEQLDFTVRLDPDYPIPLHIRLPNEVYLLHARGSDNEDSTGT